MSKYVLPLESSRLRFSFEIFNGCSPEIHHIPDFTRISSCSIHLAFHCRQETSTDPTKCVRSPDSSGRDITYFRSNPLPSCFQKTTKLSKETGLSAIILKSNGSIANRTFQFQVQVFFVSWILFFLIELIDIQFQVW